MRNTSRPAYVPISAYPDPAPVPPSRPSVSETRPSPAPAPPNASSPAAGAADLVSSFKEQGRALISGQRPWLHLLDVTALACPASAGDACFRLRRNIAYFRSNYTLLWLSVLSVSLLWHPASLFVFIALTAAWFFLFFTRDRPVALCGLPITDGIILVVLSVTTIFALVFSNVGSTVFGAIMIGTVIICLNAVLRATDNLFLDETEAASGGLVVPAYGIAL
ncbi:PRA1 family protein [Musa troglodytarum]|uniref:PRA1 family protein n=1 Tax=Musa troglodytarum TaxID=320322 RepID=A0A9E7J9V0_9LILI|nr:PRA1 family protein [Musa troglodytarum]